MILLEETARNREHKLQPVATAPVSYGTHEFKNKHKKFNQTVMSRERHANKTCSAQ